MGILSKNNTLIILVLVAVVFVSGCINGFDPTEIAKSSSAVKAFLAEYPNAKVVASLVSKADIREPCENQNLEIKDYWKVSIQDPDTKLEIKAWIDADTKQAVCVVKTGGKEKEKTQENKTHEKGPDEIKENKTDINEKDINKTKPNEPTNTVSPEINLCDNRCIEISYFHFDAEGNDHSNLNNEYVTFKSTCKQSCDLSGWTVKDIANHLYTFPSFVFDSNSTVTLHTGLGSSDKNELYWGAQSAIWNNDGDTLYLRNSKGELILNYPYTGK